MLGREMTGEADPGLRFHFQRLSCLPRERTKNDMLCLPGISAMIKRTLRLVRFSSVLCFSFSLLHGASLSAQQVDSNLYSGMKWRMIGPYRAGKVNAVAGIPGDSGLYYFGSNGGGVWKTTDGGTVWKAIFDSQPVASIGALALAPSNPNVIYVGSGENNVYSDITYGNGVYKSSDGGETWKHLGLEDTRHIARILVDPHNPD